MQKLYWTNSKKKQEFLCNGRCKRPTTLSIFNSTGSVSSLSFGFNICHVGQISTWLGLAMKRSGMLSRLKPATVLRQMRRSQRDELTKQIEEFKVRYPDRGKTIRKHTILNGLSTLLDVVLVCMAIPLVIHLFKGR